MTSANMLSAVRTLLNEASASYWADADIYVWLSEGQKEVLKGVLSMYLERKNKDPYIPTVIQKQIIGTNIDTSSKTSADFPADFVHLIGAKYTPDGIDVDKAPLRVLTKTAENLSKEVNTYLVPSNEQPIGYLTGFSLELYPIPTANSNLDLNYVKDTTDISASTQPVLPPFTHNAIVQYAFSQALLKDEREQDASNSLNKFYEELKLLYI